MDFDPQASAFDGRAGLGPEAAPAIAEALLSIAQLRASDVLLEIGAGTGEIGTHLTERCRYVGLDRSREMLVQFRHRSGSGLLLVADADKPWPISTGSVRAVFMSRVAHLLDRERLLSELARVAHPEGCCVFFGRRVRDKQGTQRTLQRELHTRLRDYGFQPRQGERDTRGHLEALLERGAVAIDEHVASTWSVDRSPADSLRAWASKPGLSGLDLPVHVRDQVLTELASWALERFTDLEAKVPTQEQYLLVGARLSGDAAVRR